MQLVKFNTTDLITTTTKFGTCTRLMSAKEFKAARGLTGNAAKLEYNNYLRMNGKSSTALLAAKLTTGEWIPKIERDTKHTHTVTFLKTASIKDPVSKDAKASADKLKTENEELRKRLEKMEADMEAMISGESK